MDWTNAAIALLIAPIGSAKSNVDAADMPRSRRGWAGACRTHCAGVRMTLIVKREISKISKATG
jgi:hypothetical protein